jgi:CubicO group peptidase (beta-lactamase class C family)
MSPRNVLLAACLAVSGCGHPGPDRDPTAAASAIDGLVRQEMAAASIPGLAVAVVERGEITHRRTVGVADPATRAAVTADTPFPIGPAARSVAAVAVLRLVQHGQLRLEDELGRQLGDLAAPSRGMSVRQLLSHPSGVPDPDALVARIVERVSRQRIEPYMAEKLFAPLGMEHTSFAGDGHLRTSLSDLVTWNRALVLGAAVDPGLRDQMWTGTGLGWVVDDTPGRRSAGHTRSPLAAFRRFIDEDMTIIVLQNGVGDPDALVGAIAAVVRGDVSR